MNYTFKQYKESYLERLERHKLEYDDHDEFTFIESELESYYESLIDIDGIEEIPFQFQFIKSFTDQELTEALKSQKEFKDFAIKSNLSSSKIIDFLESRKSELTSAPAPVVGSESKEVKTSTEKAKDYTKMPWFIVGLNIANGRIHEDKNKNNLKNTQIALELQKEEKIEKDVRPHISSSYQGEPSKGERNTLNVFDYDWKVKYIYEYCLINGIKMTEEFKKIAEKHL